MEKYATSLKRFLEKEIKNNMEYENLKFVNGSFELIVNVSPKEDTVWLSKEQMAELFVRNRSVISRHINNIYQEGELEKESTCAKNAHVPQTRNRSYETELYNLDVIISVGYRVKSQNGVVFRKWANSVLKEYLLKGYVINNNRDLITNENYANLINKVDSLGARISRIEEREKHLLIEDRIIYENQMFDAIVLLSKIVETASSSIVLIDPYFDVVALDVFKNKKSNVQLIVFMSSKTKLSKNDIKCFNRSYGNLQIRIDDRYHDRYILIDRSVCYHLGSSINYLGKRLSQITKIEDDDVIKLLKDRIQL